MAIAVLTVICVCPAGIAQSKGSGTNQAAYQGYISRLRQKLDDNWYVPEGNNKVTITSTLDTDGTVSEIVTASEPKCEPAEMAANEAFVKAQPFEGLPGGKKVKLTAVFQSASTQHGDGSRHINITLDPIK
ncbi:MAG: TonB C-terminal domain-containing protein [Cyanobacteria bacterium HKST-UBA02]|nr:TonB C-terminal domain-containing protein [Cyanobacteria bacterium HKST-UBA02]